MNVLSWSKSFKDHLSLKICITILVHIFGDLYKNLKDLQNSYQVHQGSHKDLGGYLKVFTLFLEDLCGNRKDLCKILKYVLDLVCSKCDLNRSNLLMYMYCMRPAEILISYYTR